MRRADVYPPEKTLVNVRLRDRLKLLFTGKFYIVTKRNPKRVSGVEVVTVSM